jgi:two-component system, NarL family, response regulator NreC
MIDNTMSTDRIKVLLADDHAVLRAGLRMLIDAQGDMRVVGEAGDGREAARLAAELKPDLVVMDVSMPGGSGIKAIEDVRAACATSQVLVLSMHQEPAYVRAALTAGASAYVAKRSADTELLKAIRTVAAGQTYLDPTVAGGLDTQEQPPRPAAGASLDRLSGRERQVLELLTQGYTNQQIADRLFLSVKTAETYRARIGKKLGLKDRADFVRYGLEMGLLSGGGTTREPAVQ